MDHIADTPVSIVTVLLCASYFCGNMFTDPLLRNGSDISFVSRSLTGNRYAGHNTIYMIKEKANVWREEHRTAGV
jgi:hypothetical protein